jgi:ATP-dependent helicase/nuclease subunit B
MDTIASRLILGWWLDGAPAPGLGTWTATVGPAGFLDLLSTWLGIPILRAPAPVRVAGCQAALRDGPACAFWSASFAKDPWSTAQAVLALRDALFMAGWDCTAEAGAPPRVADLARVAASLPHGEPDLLGDIVEALNARDNIALPRVSLVEPMALWPFLWRRLLSALARHATIDDLPLPREGGGNDLAALRACMEYGAGAAWRGDGSLCLLASEAEIEAADVVSAWLGAGGRDVALIKAEGGLLDPYLRARHLPRLGGDSGAAGGVLPLALALRWEPFDAAAALEFLSLHGTPLGRIAWFLSGAIQESPGHGGPTFEAAVRDAVRDLLRRLRREGCDRATRKRRAREMMRDAGFWLPAQRHARAEGMPVADVVAVCGRLVAWAQRRQDHSAAAAASALAEAATAIRQDRLSPTLLGRMLDAVAPAGTEATQAEAAHWRRAATPGQLVSPAETVVWWLTDPPATSPAPWRATERAWMAARGMHPDDAVARRGRERAALLRAVAQASARLVLVRPRAAGGEASPAHPLLADLHACFGDRLDGAWTEANMLRHGGSWAGRVLREAELQATVPPAPLREWSVQMGAVVAREVESPSGMEMLLGCSLAWVLRYGARLRPQGPASLPDMDRLTGSFLHRVLQRLFESHGAAPDGASDRARDIFDRLLPQEAAPLLQPGQEAARARALALLTQAVSMLTRRVAESGLEVEAVETNLRRVLPGGTMLQGRIDVLLRRPADGLRMVLDAKWTRSGRRHRDALAEGASVQLAAYAWLAEALGPPVTAGYFLLRQSRLHTAADEPIPGAAVAGADLSETWRRSLRSYATVLDGARAGRLLAAGVPDTTQDDDDADEDQLVLQPPCGWCDFRPLCGAMTKGR